MADLPYELRDDGIGGALSGGTCRDSWAARSPARSASSRTTWTPRARKLGLVNAIVPADRLMEETLRWAGKIAANAPLAVHAIKRLHRHGLTEDFAAHSHHVLMQLMLLFRPNDFQEDMQAFLERRAPCLSGR